MSGWGRRFSQFSMRAWHQDYPHPAPTLGKRKSRCRDGLCNPCTLKGETGGSLEAADQSIRINELEIK